MKYPLLSIAFAGLGLTAATPTLAQYYRWGDGPPPRYARPFNPYDERMRPPGYYDDLPQTRAPDWRNGPRPPEPRLEEPPRQLGSHRGPAPKVLEGGPRPAIAASPPQPIPFNSKYAPGTIVIETHGRQLLLVTSKHSALRYPISVGRQGFTWTGTEKISRIADWPDWHPPAEMRKRDPSLPEKMTGGLGNPLGAKSLYLGDTLYRIHGTNDARTVGHASSSGCFRMLNGHVVDLAARASVGTSVVIVDRLPRGSVETAYSQPLSPRGEPIYRGGYDPRAYDSRQRF